MTALSLVVAVLGTLLLVIGFGTSVMLSSAVYQKIWEPHWSSRYLAFGMLLSGVFLLGWALR